ncbi:hypothetical protein BDZ91DRAFT_677505, partial [Kalaharituber pfeilii]
MDEDAPDENDVKLYKVSGHIFDSVKIYLAKVLFADGRELGYQPPPSAGPRPLNWEINPFDVEGVIAGLEPFLESPQLLDPQLVSILTPINDCFLRYLTGSPPPPPAPPETSTKNQAATKGTTNTAQPLVQGIARVLYALCKTRGHKIITRFFPNEPHLLQTLITRLTFAPSATPDPLEQAVETQWELRFVFLLWFSHLLLTPFDLSTISSPAPDAMPADISAFIPSSDSPFPEKLAALPQLSKTLLLLATKILPSPSPRESDAAALMIVRLATRRDMLALGVLDAVVEWCLKCCSETRTGEDIDLLGYDASSANELFLRTGALKVLAGLLTTAESRWIRGYIGTIWQLVSGMEDKSAGQGDEATGEWVSAGIRKVATKIYRWIGIILLSSPSDEESDSGIIEDVVGRLLNLLGDRDTNVRFAASKSLGVLTARLSPEMASEVVNAVVGGYEEDVLYEAECGEQVYLHCQNILRMFGEENPFQPLKRQLLVSVSPEKWHGLTWTLATFLRQRAIHPKTMAEETETPLFEVIIRRIITALTFEQRRATFSMGSNVRDAACYAAWALARSYHTEELLGVPIPKEYKSYPDPTHPTGNIIQLLATHLMAVACVDPLGNIRRAASAALQELIGRHPDVVHEGIPVVQTVDYAGVSVRRRAATEIARAAAELGPGYWFGLARWGLIDGWRGIGGQDVE